MRIQLELRDIDTETANELGRIMQEEHDLTIDEDFVLLADGIRALGLAAVGVVTEWLVANEL